MVSVIILNYASSFLHRSIGTKYNLHQSLYFEMVARLLLFYHGTCSDILKDAGAVLIFCLFAKFCLVVSPCGSTRSSRVRFWSWGACGWLAACRAWPSQTHQREKGTWCRLSLSPQPCWSSTGASYGQVQWKSYVVIIYLIFWGDMRKLKVKEGPFVLLIAVFWDVHPASAGSAGTEGWLIICTQILIHRSEQKLLMLLVSR